MKKFKKAILTAFTVLTIGGVLAGCGTEADVVSENLSKSADSFEVQRRVVFFNGITDKYLLTIEGLCALDAGDNKKITVTCKTGEKQYKKHYLGLSDNVSYFIEQTDAKYESAYHYKVLFRPEEIIPDIDLQTSKGK
ncbi:site-specific recombination directionality factor RDF [Bacillus phage vB_BanS_Sophrita]|uniref:Lipoprotein n=1 Tax=Bacillus phage vB_BanS_Sophrita TaxID=2894790 RepID=A0AAE9CDT5_9CAUD|nr:site-specific recombination directionality factor RDF [Bacillus phage vB_BanS_Sophrita]UGO50669.1 putative lipoprotein [Bacillus phage vB_BanS_Sophrita]